MGKYRCPMNKVFALSYSTIKIILLAFLINSSVKYKLSRSHAPSILNHHLACLRCQITVLITKYSLHKPKYNYQNKTRHIIYILKNMLKQSCLPQWRLQTVTLWESLCNGGKTHTMLYPWYLEDRWSYILKYNNIDDTHKTSAHSKISYE